MSDVHAGTCVLFSFFRLQAHNFLFAWCVGVNSGSDVFSTHTASLHSRNQLTLSDIVMGSLEPSISPLHPGTHLKLELLHEASWALSRSLGEG